MHAERRVLHERIQAESAGTVSIVYHHLTGAVKFIGTRPGSPLGGSRKAEAVSGQATAERSASLFIDAYKGLFGIKDASKDLGVIKFQKNEKGDSFTRFQQRHGGVPVMGGEIIVQQDRSMNTVSVASRAVPDLVAGITPLIDAVSAAKTALKAVSKWYGEEPEGLEVKEPELWIYNPAVFNISSPAGSLVWRTEVKSSYLKPIRELVLVNAVNGKIPLHFNRAEGALYRKVYDNHNDPNAGLPGYGPVRLEGQGPSGIYDVDRAYDISRDVYDFYLNVLGRDSIDGQGMPIITTVRYCEKEKACPYKNDFWNGDQMVTGEGTVVEDTVAHELTHGVTDFTSNLFYFMQSGAINESMSDIFGKIIEITYEGDSDAPGDRWLLSDDDPDGAIRSLADPHLFNHPDRITDSLYYCGTKDRGGVHTNSGVGNKAAYLMSDGDYFNGYNVAGIGTIKTVKIFYEAQTRLLTSGSDYEDLYHALYRACLNLLGTNGITPFDCEQVRLATLATEMNAKETWCVYPSAPVCESGTPGDLYFDDMEGNARWKVQRLSGVSPGGYYAKYYAKSGVWSLYGENLEGVSDFAIAMSDRVALPAGNKAYLRFNHAYEFEMEDGTMYDGGVVEYSTDDGESWLDAGALPAENGYDGTVHTGAGNPLSGKAAFTGTSFGYTASRLDISSLGGKNVKFRFRIGNDQATASDGWYIDDVQIYTCEGATLAAPSGKEQFEFGRAEAPVLSANPSASQPMGFGGDPSAVGLQIGLNPFTGPVDVYLAVYAPGVDPNDYYMVTPWGVATLSSVGLAPWKAGITGVVNEKPFGDVPSAALPAGTYYFYLAVTPSGSTESYYLWSTSLQIN